MKMAAMHIQTSNIYVSLTWITLVIGLPMGLLSSLPSPLMTPAVELRSKPNGFPIAKQDIPTFHFELDPTPMG
jgi:hypothetical protein